MFSATRCCFVPRWRSLCQRQIKPLIRLCFYCRPPSAFACCSTKTIFCSQRWNYLKLTFTSQEYVMNATYAGRFRFTFAACFFIHLYISSITLFFSAQLISDTNSNAKEGSVLCIWMKCLKSQSFCELNLAEKTPNILESVQDKLLDLSDPR